MHKPRHTGRKNTRVNASYNQWCHHKPKQTCALKSRKAFHELFQCMCVCMVVCVGGEVTKPRFTQYFRGSLSGLTIRPGKIESQKVISCLQACKEGLDINSLESLDKNIKVFTNTHTVTEGSRKETLVVTSLPSVNRNSSNSSHWANLDEKVNTTLISVR